MRRVRLRPSREALSSLELKKLIGRNICLRFSCLINVLLIDGPTATFKARAGTSLGSGSRARALSLVAHFVQDQRPEPKTALASVIAVELK